MDYHEGKDKFIQSWGALASNWGINRAMAQIHALLLIAPVPLSTEDVMTELQISRGNASMNLRALMDWNLVFKELKAGDRKEYYTAEKDIWQVVRNIIIQRKKKELEPLLKMLDEVSAVPSGDDSSREFHKVVRDIKLFSSRADSTLDKLTKADGNWIVTTFMGLM